MSKKLKFSNMKFKSLPFILIIGMVSLSQKALAQAESMSAPPKMKPEMTQFWEPKVKVIQPGEGNSAPSDAIALFNGTDLKEWRGEGNSGPKWQIKEGDMIVVKDVGSLWTKRNFNDFQLHLEWSTPSEIVGEGQGRGNSGVLLQDRYEVQVLDSYNNRTYANGQAGSIYKQHSPLVNATRKPGDWNIYDIIYTAPRFKENGSLFSAARVTVIHNGVVIQNNVYKAHGPAPIQLQNHGNPVRYRNIWIREL
jgi:hypothetical protein